MSCEQVTKEHYIEGLSRLAGNVKLIDYHKTGWQYASHLCRQEGGDFEDLQKLPELATWRTFEIDIVAELKAAAEIGRQWFRIALPNCFKLAVAIESGYYRDNSQMLLDAVVELDTTAAGLLDAGDTTRHDTKSDTQKKSKKIRPMNTKAVDCARRYKSDKGQTHMKTIIEDYVEKFGGSAESIMRTLNDNPDQWKGDI